MVGSPEGGPRVCWPSAGRTWTCAARPGHRDVDKFKSTHGPGKAGGRAGPGLGGWACPLSFAAHMHGGDTQGNSRHPSP